jgi:SAM-dependent methyltransferase
MSDSLDSAGMLRVQESVLPEEGNAPRSSVTLARARQWFADADRVAVFAEFEHRYSEIPRRFFIEVAVATLNREPKAVLDLGCGTGRGLVYLRERFPQARIVGIPVSRHLHQVVRQRVPEDITVLAPSSDGIASCVGSFDLILCYSSMRLWSDPVELLRAIVRLLAPSGLACLLDFRRDIEPGLCKRLLDRLDDASHRLFLEAQLAAAFATTDISPLLARAGIDHYRLGVGGLAGFAVDSREACDLLRSDAVGRLLFQLPHQGFRTAEAADLVYQLFIGAQA